MHLPSERDVTLYFTYKFKIIVFCVKEKRQMILEKKIKKVKMYFD